MLVSFFTIFSQHYEFLISVRHNLVRNGRWLWHRIIITSHNFCWSSLTFHNALSCGYLFRICASIRLSKWKADIFGLDVQYILWKSHVIETKFKIISDSIFLHSKTDAVPSEVNRTFQLISILLHLCYSLIWRVTGTG